MSPITKTWSVSFRIDREDVALLRAALNDPPAGANFEAAERLLERLNRVWKRKEVK